MGDRVRGILGEVTACYGGHLNDRRHGVLKPHPDHCLQGDGGQGLESDVECKQTNPVRFVCSAPVRYGCVTSCLCQGQAAASRTRE